MAIWRFNAVVLLALAVPAAGADFSAAAAQEGPQGIGFARAEEGTWWCSGGDPVDALNCAREQCIAEGGGQECYRTTWCYPAGWSGLMLILLPDFHTTVPMCGAPSRAALEGAMRAFCEGSDHAGTCELYYLIGPDGVELPLDDPISFDGGGLSPDRKVTSPGG